MPDERPDQLGDESSGPPAESGPADEPSPVPETLGSYRVCEPIGGGGFSRVFRAIDSERYRDVALKLLGDGSSGHQLPEEVRRAFIRESKSLGPLSEHPNIVTLYDTGFTDDGRPYLVMPYYRQGSLGERLKRGETVPVLEVLQTGIEISHGLQAAHERGIIHRDIKPDNIFVSQYGSVLGDFGIAALQESPWAWDGTTSLTLVHGSPELLEGQEPTIASDLYAFGSTLYALLAGRSPFARADRTAVIRAIMREEAAPLPPERSTRELSRLIAELLSKEPSARPRSVASVRARLELALTEHNAQQAKAVPADRRWAQDHVEASAHAGYRPNLADRLGDHVSDGDRAMSSDQSQMARHATSLEHLSGLADGDEQLRTFDPAVPASQSRSRARVLVVTAAGLAGLLTLAIALGVFLRVGRPSTVGEDSSQPSDVLGSDVTNAPTSAPLLVPLSPPEGLTIVRLDPTTVEISWDASSVGLAGVKIESASSDDEVSEASPVLLRVDRDSSVCVDVSGIGNDGLLSESRTVCER